MPKPRQESSWRPVVEFVAQYHQQNSQGPSEAEIAEAIGKSPSAARFQIMKLLEDGTLIRTPGKHRSLRLA